MSHKPQGTNLSNVKGDQRKEIYERLEEKEDNAKRVEKCVKKVVNCIRVAKNPEDVEENFETDNQMPESRIPTQPECLKPTIPSFLAFLQLPHEPKSCQWYSNPNLPTDAFKLSPIKSYLKFPPEIQTMKQKKKKY